ncbi:hypothetical protein O181_021612 [Austropuccinia psidii MF-1]|uniref:Uncharacterized protein n=1 Tax=Austropuccinia psidii MF-1 TaxID=1389203 RepID=A0A9Q3CDZ3_9BASI|nr:hypothetical protein [Austropuccinia psidii MF-1]
MLSMTHGPYSQYIPWDPLGPFWSKYNEAKGGQGRLISGLKARWVHLSPFWAPISSVPKMAKRTLGPKIGHLQPPEATSLSPESLPLHSGEGLSFTNLLCNKDSGMVHIWYNTPLCTIFSQLSNGDGFRIKLGLFN